MLSRPFELLKPWPSPSIPMIRRRLIAISPPVIRWRFLGEARAKYQETAFDASWLVSARARAILPGGWRNIAPRNDLEPFRSPRFQ